MSAPIPSLDRGALLRAAVSALPDTPDGVAGLLRSCRLSGRRRSVSDCPLARLFGGMLGGRLVVGPAGVFLFLGREGGRRYEYAPASPAVAEFVERFDDGGYPDLVA